MFFHKGLLLLAFLFAGSMTVLARPVEFRDAPSVDSISTNLQTSTSSILSKIKSLADSKTATESNIVPLTNELIQALSNAKASIAGAQDVTESNDVSDVANIIEEIIADIANVLDSLLGSDISELGSILTSIDDALGEVLLGLEIVVDGVINVVDGLLTSVTAGLLSSLSFSKTLSALKM